MHTSHASSGRHAAAVQTPATMTEHATYMLSRTRHFKLLKDHCPATSTVDSRPRCENLPTGKGGGSGAVVSGSEAGSERLPAMMHLDDAPTGTIRHEAPDLDEATPPHRLGNGGPPECVLEERDGGIAPRGCSAHACSGTAS